jgi:tRNA (guanine37-N1)-methyltransferase
MKFHILTLFPESFSYLEESIIKRAVKSGLIEIKIHNLRDWSTDKHKTVDDHPFGGNPGMLMKVEPIYLALKDLGFYPKNDPKKLVILTSAKGELWNQQLAKDYSASYDEVLIICGHYEGVDHRVVEHLIDKEISVGNYVLSGGELPSMIILDSMSRLIPGVLGNPDSLLEESNNDSDMSEYPQYTRPANFQTQEGEEWATPEVLLSGNHAEIEKWKKENS